VPVTCPGTADAHQKDVKRANWALRRVRLDSSFGPHGYTSGCYTSTVGGSGHHRHTRSRRAIRGPQVAAAAGACDDDGNETLRCVLVQPSQKKTIMANGLWNGLDEKTELFYSGVTASLDAAGRVDLGEGRSYPLVKIQK